MTTKNNNIHCEIKTLLREYKEKKTDPRIILSRLITLYSWEDEEKEKRK